MTSSLSLLHQRHPLAPPSAQRARLAQLPLARSFDEALAGAGLPPLAAVGIDVLQINVGKKCNQTCAHCHVDAGPDRRESMPDDVVDACLEVLARTDIRCLDVTGGAPELHPRFEELVVRARALGRHVIDRCNLTILTMPRYRHLPAFFAKHGVEIVASLPYFDDAGTDAQRGEGVYAKSIAALQTLNRLGYGVPGSKLSLVLVANPVGAFLPAPQASLEADFKRALAKKHGVQFSRLIAITNMPISRYLEWLDRTGNTARYMAKLVAAFNAAAVSGLMCRTTLSVGFDGRLFDCDFNQMLDLPVVTEGVRTIHDFSLALLSGRSIAVGSHCFGCTAGQGSSCGGATTGT